MILPIALLLALGAEPNPGAMNHGEWRGGCFRDGSLEGMDHELCRAWIWVDSLGLGAQIERDAAGLTVTPWNGECPAYPGIAFMPAVEFAGSDRTTKVTAFVQQQIDRLLKTCKPSAALQVNEADIAGILSDSDGLRVGSFVPLDPAARAPAAAVCGQQLEQSWRKAIKAHSRLADAEVRLTMYTLSEKGPERAKQRIAALPAMMQDLVSFGMGPGGQVISARKPAQAWQDAPADWFVTICDVGIESWSSFVELTLYDHVRGSTKVAVRAGTGVEGPKGYAVWSGEGP